MNAMHFFKLAAFLTLSSSAIALGDGPVVLPDTDPNSDMHHTSCQREDSDSYVVDSFDTVMPVTCTGKECTSTGLRNTSAPFLAGAAGFQVLKCVEASSAEGGYEWEMECSNFVRYLGCPQSTSETCNYCLNGRPFSVPYVKMGSEQRVSEWNDCQDNPIVNSMIRSVLNAQELLEENMMAYSIFVEDSRSTGPQAPPSIRQCLQPNNGGAGSQVETIQRSFISNANLVGLSRSAEEF